MAATQLKLGIINSTFHQAGVDTATGPKHISRIGFDCMDIFTEALGIQKKEIALASRRAAKLGLPIVSLPVVAVGLIDSSQAVRFGILHNLINRLTSCCGVPLAIAPTSAPARRMDLTPSGPPRKLAFHWRSKVAQW